MLQANEANLGSEDMFWYWNVKSSPWNLWSSIQICKKPVEPKRKIDLEIGNQSMIHKDQSTAEYDILKLKRA